MDDKFLGISDMGVVFKVFFFVLERSHIGHKS
jgi:hypothetical protein